MGKQIYFTDDELGYIWLVFSNIDVVEDEDEERVRDSIFDKVSNAKK